MWYTLSRARITRSLLLKPTWHLAHLMPNSLRARGGRSAARGTPGHALSGGGRRPEGRFPASPGSPKPHLT